MSVSLVNEAEFKGRIVSFDQYAILFARPNLHLVYKHAIFTIVPSHDFKLSPELGLEPAPQPQPKARISKLIK